MIASDGAPTLAGSITWKPCPPDGPPSPWIETATAARASLPIAARLSTHGPTPMLSERVVTTLAPAALSSDTSRVATSKVNAASEYPELVEVPVVSQGLVPVPIGTSWLMISGCAPLPPLCPGSTSTVLPDTARRSRAPLVGGEAELFELAEPDGDGPAEVGPGPDEAAPGSDEDADAPASAQCAAAGVPGPQPASGSSAAMPTRATRPVRIRARTRLMLLGPPERGRPVGGPGRRARRRSPGPCRPGRTPRTARRSRSPSGARRPRARRRGRGPAPARRYRTSTPRPRRGPPRRRSGARPRGPGGTR